ncbi:MAG: SEC-C metal-binding domain-containing protein, partial [Rhodospirillaceae bacterium]|nr:SEC-C metal-binding domain-containing protein [Rhodospirillaceae bacterium]
IADEEIRDRMVKESDIHAAAKLATYGADVWRLAEKSLLLQILDQSWKDHLLTLDHLRQGIGLRAYGQRDPLNEYRGEAFEMFESMLSSLREQTTQLLSHVELRMAGSDDEDSPVPERRAPQMRETRRDPALAGAGAGGGAGAFADEAPAQAAGGGRAPASRRAGEAGQAAAGQSTVRRAAFDQSNPETWGRVGRNAPCPCGSGLKFKRCHGKLA